MGLYYMGPLTVAYSCVATEWHLQFQQLEYGQNMVNMTNYQLFGCPISIYVQTDRYKIDDTVIQVIYPLLYHMSTQQFAYYAYLFVDLNAYSTCVIFHSNTFIFMIYIQIHSMYTHTLYIYTHTHTIYAIYIDTTLHYIYIYTHAINK